ncbi:MAG TPA: hypothetical protein VF759_17630 [Allosphingosinicella sp.]|jgi:hypothetical protein
MLDRRVQILDGGRDAAAAATISSLRDRPYLVLLGEPGIGKTTVLEVEAAAAGTTVIKVRELINNSVDLPGGTLFLDALDEYRVGATDLDKVHQLVGAIRAAGTPQWRLTCRAEDWQKGADLDAIRRTTAGAPITVAQLLPLEIPEALAVLQALGEADPESFVDRALAMGAGGLLESPLSLKLLREAVIGDKPWPTTRFALFDQATSALAHEENKVHRLDRSRASAEAILTAAATTSLFLLVTGSRFLWRSGALPRSGDARANLPASALGFDPPLVDDLVGSALFRGEGEAFEPVHRTIAEFLGGRALARAIIGGASTAALPLGRAAALITGKDGRAPTDLRGLYAWFAAHLAKFGAHAEARELVEADAVSALVYGDAAVFDTAAKRAMLANLDRHDPYFRASDVGTTSVGGLACEELSEDLAHAIEKGDGTHRMMTVYEVLGAGPPVASLKPRLRAIALDPARPEWQRTRATDAWLNGQADPAAARRDLFDALSAEPRSAAREAVRAELLSAMPPELITLADLTSLIGDFVRLPDDNVIMRLYGLRSFLVAHPRPALFDAPLDWLSSERGRRHDVEVEDLLDHALAAAIRGTPDLDAPRLWRWLVHAREDKWTNLRNATRPAVAEWLKANPSRELALFESILGTDDPAEGPWMIGTYYIMVAGSPNGQILDHLVTRAAEAKGAIQRRPLAIAVNLARRYDVGQDAYWRLFAFLESMRRSGKRLLRELTVVDIERWRMRQYTRARQTGQAEAKRRSKQLATLRRNIAGIASALYKSTLAWAAEIYFHPRDKKEAAQSGLERVAAESDDAVLDAILTGWRVLATADTPGVHPETLGQFEAKGGHFYSEYAAMAGLDRLRSEGDYDLLTLPLTLAIIVLRSGWITHPSGSREALERWAWDRLNLDPVAGAAALESYWEAILAHGGHSNHWHQAGDDGGGKAVALASAAMLTRHPALPPDTLRTLIAVAAKHLDRAALAGIAAAALAGSALPAKQRAIWGLTLFALDPLGGRDPLSGNDDADLLALCDGISGTRLIDVFPRGSGVEQVAIAAGMFALVAPHAEPYVERRSGRVLQSHRQSDAGNAFLNRLAALATPDATAAIAALKAKLTAYPKWDAALKHAAEQQGRARRDAEFLPPDAAAVAEALAGRAPVNAADLRAVVVNELRRFARELRTGATSPWRDYWNTDAHGKPTTPKIENIARDITLTRLHDRLVKYRIAVALPEAQRRDDSRADVLIVSGASRNLPIEAKRHYHSDLWHAAEGQLQGYVADEGADGYGVLLIFWFGDVAPPPARRDGVVPTSGQELAALLEADLSPELRARTDIVVLDVAALDRAAKRRSNRAPRARKRRRQNLAP